MTETPTREKQEPRTLADALIEAAVEGRAAPVRIIRMDKDPDGKTFAQHFDAVKGGVVPRPDLDPPRFPTRERLEKAWATRSERPLVVGTYSVSLLAKLSAGAYARRLISKEPSDFPAYLGWSGNRMGDAILDEAGVPKEAREFNLHFRAEPVALSGHPDGVDVDAETKTITVLECKRLTFPTAEAVEKAKRQGLCYAALIRMALMNARLRLSDAPHAERHAVFQRPPWSPGPDFAIDANPAWRFHVQVLVAGAFEPEIHDVPAPDSLLGEVLAEFMGKATAIHESAIAGTPDAADAWDRNHAKERPVEAWAKPPAPVAELLNSLAAAKEQADTAEAVEDQLRAELRDAMRLAGLAKVAGSGLSASWVTKNLTKLDRDAVAKELGLPDLAKFEQAYTRDDFSVRAAGKKPKGAA